MTLSADQQKARVSQIMRARQAGRYSGPKLFVSGQTFTGGSLVISTPQMNIGTDPPLADLWIYLFYRVVIGTANMTSVAAEAPQSYLTRITLIGTFRGNNSVVTLLDMSGATLFAYQRLFNFRGNSAFFGSTSAAMTRNAEPSTPFGQALATFGNTGTYDIQTFYRVPIGPVMPEAAHFDAFAYKLRAGDWPDGIQVTLYLGDNTAYGTPAGGTTFTYTSFGSASGSAAYSIYVNRIWLGKGNEGMAANYPAAVLIRREQTVPVGLISAVGSNLTLFAPTKTRTPNIILKSGLSNAGSPPNVFASLSQLMLQNLSYMKAEQAIRSVQDVIMDQEYYSEMFGTLPIAGYYYLSFMEALNPNAMLRANTPAFRDSTLAVTANILVANAANQINYVQESVLGDPQTRLPGTPAN